MRLLVQFSRRFLYRHPGQLVLALIGIAAGVAVVAGVAMMRDVLTASLDMAAEALSGQDSLRIEHPLGYLDEQHYVRLATTQGAPTLIPVLRGRVRHQGQILELLALDPLSLPDGGPMRLSGPATGPLLTAGNSVIASERTAAAMGLSAGQTFEARITGRMVKLDLMATFSDRRELDNRLIMDLANAQDLLGQAGKLSWIEAPGQSRDWLTEHLPDELVILTSGQRRDSAARLTAGMRTNLTALSLLALVVGLFVVHSVLAFLLVQRRSQIGILRAIGVTRSQVAGLLAAETLILAGLGALVGLVLGTWLSGQLLSLVRAPAAELYGMITPATVAPSPGLYALIWAITMVMALISIGGLIRAAQAIPPGQLSRQQTRAGPAGHRHLRPVLIVVLIGLGAAGVVVMPTLTGVLAGLFMLLSGTALLIPDLGMALIRLWHRWLPHHLSGRALGMLGKARLRLGPALSALGLALGLSAGIAMMVMSFRVTVDDWVDRLLRADAYLTRSVGPIEPDLVEQLSAWPELAAISSVRQRRLPDGRNLAAYDLPPAAWAGFEWLAGGDEQARHAFEQGLGVLVSEPLARHQDLRLSDPIDIPSPAGIWQAHIVGIYRDYASDRGIIAVDGAHYRDRFDDPIRDSLGLYLVTGAGSLEDMNHRLAGVDEALVLIDRNRVREQTLAVFDRTFRITWALAVLVGIIAAIALISALLALGLERGRDYATLRALGLTRFGLFKWVLAQTTGLAATAAVLAIPISLMIHVVLSLAVQPRAFGWSVTFTLPWQPWLVLIPLTLLCGLLAGLYPAWTITRAQPAPLLKSR
jgi:putative ABC transport system permease protein